MGQGANDFFSEEKKSLYVCYDKETEKYYNLITGLLSEDKKSKYRVIRISEKDYIGAKTVTSENKVIFLGDTKYVKKNILPNINIKYDKFGMSYGWLGNIGTIFYQKQLLRWILKKIIKILLIIQIDKKKYIL